MEKEADLWAFLSFFFYYFLFLEIDHFQYFEAHQFKAWKPKFRT